MPGVVAAHNDPELSLRIDDLVDQLTREDDGSFVYRGQPRDYGALLPSGARGAVSTVNGAAHHLDRRRLVAQRTVRAQQQERFRRGLTQVLGPGLGHVFAQQYGLTSDVIDVTTSPRVAAFFATRQWPTCTHIANPDASPGVIYRWKNPNPPRTPAEFKADSILGSVAPLHPIDASPVRAIVRFPDPGTPEHIFARDMHDAWITFPSTIFTFTEIATTIEDQLANSNALYTAGWQMEDIGSSRWAAQEGGFLRPETLYRGHLGPRPDEGYAIIEDEGLGEPRLNRGVLADLPVSIADAAQIGPPDRFFFGHSSTRVDMAPESLWPSVLEDPLFRYVALMAWARHGNYFDETRANYPWDPVCGLIDRGFYPEVTGDDYDHGEWQTFNKVLPIVPQ